MKRPVYLIGRQPIFDRNQNVFAYELLYRSSLENYVNVMDGDQATLDVLMNTFSQAGLNTLVGNKTAFINLTRNFLIGRYPIPLPANRTVLEILEDIDIDPELIDALGQHLLKGYQFALDDVDALDARVASLISLAKYIKVDINSADPNELPRMVQELKKKKITLIAEKVETHEEYQLCRGMGFDYFQGFFFYRPEIVSLRKFETSRLVILQVMTRLLDPNVSMAELEKIISQDVALGYRLLKLVNSGYYAFASPINSIRHAVSLIGIRPLSNWLSLFLMARIENKPNELCDQALIRAKAAEMIAVESGFSNPETYFMTGLFSVLDALLDMPMTEVVSGMNLSEEIVTALLSRKGSPGQVLSAIEGMETLNWDPILLSGIAIEKINEIYLAAIEGTNKLRNAL